MGLPERLSHLDSGIPSDLNAHWHRGYKFPSVSSVLRSTAANLRGDETESEVANDKSVNGLTRTKCFQDTIPLPLLLEVQRIEESRVAAADAASCLINSLPGDRNVSGHKLLAMGSQHVDSLIDRLVSKQELTAGSLSEPTENWQRSDSDGQVDSHILSYGKRRKVVVPSGLIGGPGDPEDTAMAAENTIDFDYNDTENLTGKATDVVHNLKESSGGSVEDFSSKFVAGKSTSEKQGSCTANKYLRIDPALCPIKLSFTDPGKLEWVVNCVPSIFKRVT
jgi:hypothetical protein